MIWNIQFEALPKFSICRAWIQPNIIGEGKWWQILSFPFHYQIFPNIQSTKNFLKYSVNLKFSFLFSFQSVNYIRHRLIWLRVWIRYNTLYFPILKYNDALSNTIYIMLSFTRIITFNIIMCLNSILGETTVFKLSFSLVSPNVWVWVWFNSHYICHNFNLLNKTFHVL